MQVKCCFNCVRTCAYVLVHLHNVRTSVMEKMQNLNCELSLASRTVPTIPLLVRCRTYPDTFFFFPYVCFVKINETAIIRSKLETRCQRIRTYYMSIQKVI